MFRKLALGLLFIVAASLNGATTAMAQSRMYGSNPSFYHELSPYGRWVENREFGQVWIPNVERTFKPYATRGHWAMTEYGNTWVSDYDWGWAPFHYGRWTYDSYYGWIWIPGNEWAPAWVSWRSDNDYYGWAPLGPGVDININVYIPLERWIFVPKRYIVQRNVYDYCLPRQRVVYVYRNTAVINNVYVIGSRRYACGPYRDDIERYSRQKINVYRIESHGRPGRMEERGGTLRVYRPEQSDRGYRNPRDESKISDYRPREERYNREPSARNDNNYNQRRESPGNAGNSSERIFTERNRPTEGRYTRQREQGDRSSNDAPQPGTGSSNEPKPENSNRYERPDRSRDNGSPSKNPSGERTQQNPGGRSTDQGNSSQSSSSGRSRPTRG